jgi:hypothetical protein
MNSLTLECKTCSNYIAVENTGDDSAIETTPCGVCGVKLCAACDQVECAECGELMCVECAHHGLGECMACVNARLAELETASVPCTCGNGDYADVRGCESCDSASPYRRELARTEETAAALAIRKPVCRVERILMDTARAMDRALAAALDAEADAA